MTILLASVNVPETPDSPAFCVGLVIAVSIFVWIFRFRNPKT